MQKRQMELLGVLIGAVAAVQLVSAARAAGGGSAYTFQSLGIIGSDTDNTGPGINNASSIEVVGQIGTGATQKAGYSISGGALQAFGTSNGADGSANSVNDGGVAVGFYTVGANQLAFYSNSGNTLSSLPTFGGQASYATAVNGNSATFSVVGQSQYSGTSGAYRAFSWSSSSPSTLKALGPSTSDDGLGATSAGASSAANGLNASGIIVGNATAQSTGVSHAFVYNPTSSKMYDLGVGTTDGSGQSSAQAINAGGQIVGLTDTGTSTSDSPGQAFIYTGLSFTGTGGTATDTTLTSGTLHVLGSLDGTTSSAFAINDAGVVVGTSSADDQSTTHAFLENYNAGGTMQDLNLVGLSGLPSGWTLDSATGINNAGDITGIADDGTSQYAFLLTPSAVPEPASMGVIFVTTGLVSLKRRRSNMSVPS